MKVKLLAITVSPAVFIGLADQLAPAYYRFVKRREDAQRRWAEQTPQPVDANGLPRH